MNRAMATWMTATGLAAATMMAVAVPQAATAQVLGSDAAACTGGIGRIDGMVRVACAV